MNIIRKISLSALVIFMMYAVVIYMAAYGTVTFMTLGVDPDVIIEAAGSKILNITTTVAQWSATVILLVMIWKNK